MDHSLSLSDHAVVWLTMDFDMPKQDLPAHTIRLKHINAAYFKHASFRHMIQDAIAPLQTHAQYVHIMPRIPLCTICSMLLRYMEDPLWLIGERK